jgi:signal transduction histidine kinase
VISECLRAARVLAQNKLIEVTGPELAEMPCYGDEGLIRQLILILLDNAVKYTPDGGLVTLRASRLDGDRYLLEVSDTGRGIPEDAKKLIFTRFFRTDRTHSRVPGERSKGAGLGLAIGHWIAAAHGGSLTLVASRPQGSTFRVCLPCQATAAGKPARNVQLG